MEHFEVFVYLLIGGVKLMYPFSAKRKAAFSIQRIDIAYSIRRLLGDSSEGEGRGCLNWRERIGPDSPSSLF